MGNLKRALPEGILLDRLRRGGVLMTQPLDFQSVIMTLQRFWAEHDCLIWQPYYTQVGAGR